MYYPLAMAMTNGKIDKRIPVPPDHRNKKYPLDIMEVGDSFVIRGNRPAASIANAQRRLNRKFTVRSIGADRFRVWRVK
jgi:hypothetical protein